MKRILLLLPIACCVFLSQASLYGDVNGDGEVTVADVQEIYDGLLGLKTMSQSMDVNGDSEVTTADVTAIYEVILGLVEPPQPTRGKFYLCDAASWGDMALYAWPEGGTLPAWPGLHYSAMVTHNGKNYYQFDLDDNYYGVALNYIANNYGAVSGATNRQVDLMSGFVMGDEDVYVTVEGSNGSYSYTIDPVEEQKDPVVYVHSELGWSDYSLYVWANSADVSAPWPGEHYTSTTTINGEMWYVFEMPEIYRTTASTNWILNNNGGGQQHDLMQGFSYSEDVYVRVSSDGSFTVSSSPGSGGGGDDPQPGDSSPLDVDNTSPLNDKHQVIYEMNVGSFTSAGTFAAARDKLSDLRKLGIDIVWLMPIYPRGGGINSPYAATNFKATNSSYGSIADLKSLVNKAHELGMKVILDWVPNHTATNAVWVTEHPEYYTKSGGNFVHPNNYGDVYQLNYGNADLCNAMNDCLKFWIDQADVDGYRCDYVSSSAIPASYWQSTIPMLRNYKSGKSITMVAEADVVRDATKLLNVGFDYDYAWNLQSGKLERFGSSGTNASTLKSYCQEFVNESAGKSFDRMTYLTNHDQNYNDGGKTMASMYGNNRYAFTTLIFTLYGMPLLYNGQEVGNDQILNYFNDTKINWSSNDVKMQNTIRTLVALRHTQAALANGVAPTFLTSNSSGVMAYTKTSGSNTVLVVVNVGNTAVEATLSGVSAGDYAQWLDSRTIAQGCTVSQLQFTSSPKISLEAKGYAVFVKQ